MSKFAASMMMVLSLMSAATLAGVSTSGAAQARPQSTSQSTSQSKYWCAAYHCGGENCGFSSYAQCSAAVSGAGGFCRVVEGTR